MHNGLVYLRTPRDIGALIREHRRRQGLTQQELAERVGVRRLWVSQTERGKATAELGLVLRTLQGLGVELSTHTDSAALSLDVPDIDAVVEHAKP